jgi:hypothetical protein
MSNNTMLFALYRMGYHSRATVHGFRAMASTALNEMGFRSDVIERQLAHKEKNAVRAAYNRAEYLKERRTMMDKWADYIDAICGRGAAIGCTAAGALGRAHRTDTSEPATPSRSNGLRSPRPHADRRWRLAV